MQKYLVLFIIINFLVSTISIGHVPRRFCGKIQILTPFSSPLNRIIFCKSNKLYFRTSLGLFPISSIDYTTKTLIISHSSLSSSKHYVSASLLSAGFPPTPHPNSLLLFNCSTDQRNHLMPPPFIRNCSAASQDVIDPDHQSCLLVDDHGKLDKGFHPRDLNCSHYRRVHRRSSLEDKEEVGLGTRVSFDIPDEHVPDVCKECEKPNGNCGAGLRCICHAKQCKDKVISLSGSLNPISNVFFSLLSFTAVNYVML
ncbi:hypothetical protein Q3G72_021438 [Acer saccharum]|nr:hypothetical protein Q3G72_021438 [Acer saccharum]